MGWGKFIGTAGLFGAYEENNNEEYLGSWSTIPGIFLS